MKEKSYLTAYQVVQNLTELARSIPYSNGEMSEELAREYWFRQAEKTAEK